MTPLVIAKSALLAVPLWLVTSTLLPVKASWLKHLLSIVIGFGVAVVATLVVPTGGMSYITTFILMAGIYAVLSLGLNVQWGYTGLFNIGIAAFFAIGAFTSALVTTNMPTGVNASFTKQLMGLGMPFWVGLVAAGIVAGILAWLIGKPTLRLRDDYLAIATIGIAEMVRLVFQNERWLANGPQPLRGIPAPQCLAGRLRLAARLRERLFAPLTPRDYPYIYVAIVALVLFLLYRVLERAIRSRGACLRAVREEEAPPP